MPSLLKLAGGATSFVAALRRSLNRVDDLGMRTGQRASGSNWRYGHRTKAKDIDRHCTRWLFCVTLRVRPIGRKGQGWSTPTSVAGAALPVTHGHEHALHAILLS